MKTEILLKNILKQEFEERRVLHAVRYFISSVQKFEQGDWDASLLNASKFIEVTIKMLWVRAGKSLPEKPEDFKAGLFAQKILNGDNDFKFLEKDIRVSIPRASVFVYGIVSNRGTRHDSDKFFPNEIDASVVLPICSWILAELVRFSARESININETKKIINSLIERKYPIFETIDGRIYVDKKKFKGVIECGLLILYKIYPNRMPKNKFIDCLMSHDFKRSAIRFERFFGYIDVDENNNLLLRMTGIKKAKEILDRNR